VPLATVSGVITGALEGLERFGALNSLQVIGSILFYVTPLVVAYVHGPDLTWLIPATILARALSTVPLWIALVKILPLRGSAGFASDQAKGLLSYGGWVSVNGVLSPLFSSFDSFVIGSAIGTAAVAIYNVPYQLVHRVLLFPSALARSLFPRFSSASVKDAHLLGTRAVAAMAALSVPIMVPATVILYPFMKIWVGPEFAIQASPVGEIMVIGTWISSMALVPYALLQGQGKPRTVALLHIAETPILLGSVWVGVHYWGVVGAAVAMSIRDAIDSLSFFILAGMMRKVAPRLFSAAAWMVVALIVARSAGTSFSYHIVAAGVLFALTCSWMFAVEPAAKQLLESFWVLVANKPVTNLVGTADSESS
jgi:O-antigen/teichoic acid export membrane protein